VPGHEAIGRIESWARESPNGKTVNVLVSG
jgi:hypothetical protein